MSGKLNGLFPARIQLLVPIPMPYQSKSGNASADSTAASTSRSANANANPESKGDCSMGTTLNQLPQDTAKANRFKSSNA